MEVQAAIEEDLSGAVAGTLFRCPQATTGVVVLGGSSGRIDVGRARLFANQGSSALALRWFGGEGQPPGICEIPLETFFAATDYLIGTGCHRIVYVGTSKGAEAALCAAVHDQRVNAVVAISPSSVVWGNIGAGRDGFSWPERSSWSLDGIPLPFVPTDPDWAPKQVDGLVSYSGLFERSMKTFKREANAATIPGKDIGRDCACRGWRRCAVALPMVRGRDCPAARQSRQGHPPRFIAGCGAPYSLAGGNHAALGVA